MKLLDEVLEGARAGQDRVEDLAAETEAFEGTILPGQALTRRVNGARAVRLLAFSLNGGRDAQALRSTVLEMRFDGERTVWVPAGDFFGASPSSYSTTSRALPSSAPVPSAGMSFTCGKRR